MTRILVPTDFAEPSLAAVRYGLELAATVGGDVVLLHVVEGPSAYSYLVGGPPQLPRDYMDPAGEFFQPARAFFRAPFSQKVLYRDLCEEAYYKLETLFPLGYRNCVRTVVTAGKAADEIVAVAKEQRVDLILLGIRGKRGWRHVFRRTVTDRVRRKAMIPVITLDTSHRRVERSPAHRGVLEHRTGGGCAVSQDDERVQVGKDSAPSQPRPGDRVQDQNVSLPLTPKQGGLHGHWAGPADLHLRDRR
jgi:nucleotide-binding universal stress UspA family protein